MSSLSEYKNTSHKPVFISAEGGNEYQLPDMKITVKLSDKETNGMYEVYEEITNVGSGTPLHTHKTQWEILEVLDGKYKIKVNNDIYIAEPGSVAIVPPNIPHCFLNIHNSPSKLRFTLSPGLNFEGFIKEMSELKGIPEVHELASLLGKYGMELLGPPMTLNN